MKKIKLQITFLLLLIFTVSFSQNCDGSSTLLGVPVLINYDDAKCSFSLSATSSRINNTCQKDLNACPLNLPCFGYCYEWRLFLDNNLIDATCTINNSHTFENLTNNGDYKILIIYKRLIPCRLGSQCSILIDQGIKTVSTSTICSFISSKHSINQSATINKDGIIDINCNIQNNRVTNLRASQKIKLRPGLNSGSGSGTYFRAQILDCPKSGIESSSNDLSNYIGQETYSDNYVQKIIDRYKNNQMIKTGFSIYPNPNNGKFNIDLGSIDATAMIEIYDMMGKKVVIQKKATDKTVIDLTEHPKGIYLVKITIDSEVFNEKIIIK